MAKKNNPNISPDFVFGTLSTDELRLANMKQERSGLWHAQQLQPLDPKPNEAVTIGVHVGPDVSANRMTLYFTTDGSVPRGKHGQVKNGEVITMQKTDVIWETLLWGYSDAWQGAIPPQKKGTVVQYIIEAWHSYSNSSQYAGGKTPTLFSFYVDTESVPAWLNEAVIYQIFVDRFAPDPDKNFIPHTNLTQLHHGTLKGITHHLDYLQDLGITCLWLTPIFESPTYHRYDTTNFGKIDPALGTESDLKTLIANAHTRGIRMILDFVANHISNQHPVFIEAKNNLDSDKRDWFFFDDNFLHGYNSFFDVAAMPKINTDHLAARRHLIEHAQYWLKAGVDGYRLDHAQGPTHAFWSAFRHGTRMVKTDSVTFGEVVEPPTLQRSFAGRMDGTLDFLLHQALRQFFAFHQINASQFNAFLHRHFSYFPTDFVMPSFLDNHDMNRFLWAVGNDTGRLKLAALCQFTLPGPPIIYYGTEIGLSQRKNVGQLEEARLPMPWDEAQDKDLFAFYQTLIALRHEGKANWGTMIRPILIDDEMGILLYSVGKYGVALNNSKQNITLTLPEWASANIALVTDPAINWDNAILKLPAFGGACFRLEPIETFCNA